MFLNICKLEYAIEGFDDLSTLVLIIYALDCKFNIASN